MKMYAIIDMGERVWSSRNQWWVILNPYYDSPEEYLIRHEDLCTVLNDIKKCENCKEVSEVYRILEYEVTELPTDLLMTAEQAQEKILKGEL